MKVIALFIWVLFVWGIATTVTLRAQQSPTGRLPIIDMHIHAFGTELIGDSPPNPKTGKVPTARTGKEFMDATLAEMKLNNIVKAVISGPRSDVSRWLGAYPDRIIAGTYIAENAPLPDITGLREDFRARRLSILAELGLQYRGLSPNDASMEPFWMLAEELDIPVGVHTGLSFPGTPYSCCPKFRASLGNPALLEEVLIRHPRLRVYLMHAGYPYLEETKAIMHIYPQVYADLAAIDWLLPREEFHDYLKALERAGYGKRLMFGSDQMVWPEGIGMAIEGIESAEFLTPAQKRDIFYNNAVRFLRLDEKSLRSE